MKTEIETAMKVLTEKVNNNVKADEALKFTQAALNLAHTSHVLGLTKDKK